MFGAPVQLTHDGSASYKTTFGGCLTVLLKLVLVIYTMLKFKEIVGEADWMIEQQVVTATKKDLEKLHALDSEPYKNLSLSLQFKKKRSIQTKEKKIEAEKSRDENRRRRLLDEKKEVDEGAESETVDKYHNDV